MREIKEDRNAYQEKEHKKIIEVSVLVFSNFVNV